MNKGSKILFGIIGVVATGGLLLLLKDNKKTEPSYSGCNGLKGNESIDNMCNHLSSEHHQTEREIINILISASKNKNHCTKDVVDVWDKELKHHFQEEENVVFPSLIKKDKSLQPVIDDLLEEHKFFYSAINEMKRIGNCNNLSVMFCEKLLQHIDKEEELLKIYKINI